MHKLSKYLLLIILILIAFTQKTITNVNIIDNNSDQINQFINETTKQYKIISANDIKIALTQAKFKPEIITSMQRPAEKLHWGKYKNYFLTEKKINDGVKFWQTNKNILNKAYAIYGVPPELIIAIIGVETHYGQHKGKHKVLDSLATLAFNYPARAKFFKSELQQFLVLTKEQHWQPEHIYGSYAGAIGFPQFLSSSFRHYAVDFSGDGKKDIINNQVDAIGSVANYFYKHGWKTNDPIIIPTKIINNNYKKLSNKLKPSLHISQYEQYGIYPLQKIKSKTPAALIKFDYNLNDNSKSEYWLGLNNFYVITRYNSSANYAMSVYKLSLLLKEKYQQISNNKTNTNLT